MFRSVRWRLLLNSLAVSLAAILVVGVVTLILVCVTLSVLLAILRPGGLGPDRTGS